MKVVCCQFDIVWEDKPANYAKVRALLDGIKIPPGSLVILPEMFATGFSMNVVGIREGAASETESFLASAARFYGLFMLGGMVTVGANGNQEIVSIKIEREVINPEDAQMLEDLVLAACNEALRKSRELVQAEMGKITGGLRIPGLTP